MSILQSGWRPWDSYSTSELIQIAFLLILLVAVIYLSATGKIGNRGSDDDHFYDDFDGDF